MYYHAVDFVALGIGNFNYIKAMRSFDSDISLWQ